MRGSADAGTPAMPEIIRKHSDLVTQLSAREICRDRSPAEHGSQLATFALAIAVLFAVLVALRLWRSPDARP